MQCSEHSPRITYIILPLSLSLSKAITHHVISDVIFVSLLIIYIMSIWFKLLLLF